MGTLTQQPQAERRIDSECYVEGLAARYEPYELLRFDDGEVIYEQFEPTCFYNCDMSDVILRYNHEGRVFARQSNGSLIVEPTAEGLFIAADLSRTAAAREMYEDITAQMITKMSWAFAPGDWEFNEKTSTIIHHTVRKIYDVSPVSIPANNSTSIGARALGSDGVIAQVRQELAERQRRIAIINLKLKMGGLR